MEVALPRVIDTVYNRQWYQIPESSNVGTSLPTIGNVGNTHNL